MLHSGFNILPRSVVRSANSFDRSDNFDVIMLKHTMENENPYDSPSSAPNEDAMIATLSSEKAQFARFALLGLRLLGVMFIVDGMSGLAGSLTTVGVQFSQSYSPRSMDMAYYDAYNVGALVESGLFIIAGIYLLLSPRWLLKVFFLPASQVREDESIEIADEAE